MEKVLGLFILFGMLFAFGGGLEPTPAYADLPRLANPTEDAKLIHAYTVWSGDVTKVLDTFQATTDRYIFRAGQAGVQQERPGVHVKSTSPGVQMVLDAGKEFDVPEITLAAVSAQESGSDPNSEDSTKGAVGIMQVMPDTAKGIAQELGVKTYDLRDPQTNARFGAYYLSEKLKRYGHDWGLAAYNCGPACVDSFQTAHPESKDMAWADVIARWPGKLPDETVAYVSSINALEEKIRAESAPVDATQSVAAGESVPITVDTSNAFGFNVAAALDANGGSLRDFTIQPGGSWSFNRSIGDPSRVAVQDIHGTPGAGWCDLAARYVQAARKVLPAEAIAFQDHNTRMASVAREDEVLIWNTNGDAGDADLVLKNTLAVPLHFAARYNGDATVSIIVEKVEPKTSVTQNILSLISASTQTRVEPVKNATIGATFLTVDCTTWGFQTKAQGFPLDCAHGGDDLQAPDGTDVHMPYDCISIDAGGTKTSRGNYPEGATGGDYVMCSHPDPDNGDTIEEYIGHIEDEDGLAAPVGTKIAAGTLIGHIKKGKGHVHWQMKRNGMLIDPLGYWNSH